MFCRSKSVLLLAAFLLIWPISLSSSEDAPGRMLGGSENSPIRIDVFSDFQCSACREFYLSTVRKVLKEYSSKDKVCVVYHEFPLSYHPYALEAARYCEAAWRMGVQKLLPVMESLYVDQANWVQDGTLEDSVARALSSEDFLKLKEIMKDPGIDEAIEKEVQLGAKEKIAATPTLIISYTGKKKRVEGLVTYLVMKTFIEDVLSE
jgi:protein-disulfide isomerase